mmetsp:Transcript_17081/g.42992  ORF Transcript_17081/g.42992 Transcript_17081/m.42992 type:complete len:233 (-) Transcript_17081:655-1353(-)
MLTHLSNPPTNRCEPDWDSTALRILESRLNVETVAPDSMLITCTIFPEPTASLSPSPENATDPSRTDCAMASSGSVRSPPSLSRVSCHTIVLCSAVPIASLPPSSVKAIECTADLVWKTCSSLRADWWRRMPCMRMAFHSRRATRLRLRFCRRSAALRSTSLAPPQFSNSCRLSKAHSVTHLASPAIASSCPLWSSAMSRIIEEKGIRSSCSSSAGEFPRVQSTLNLYSNTS